ncbi:MAG: hypothetical protein AB7E51_00385 [Pseudodesulfovibrio sp.]|uniref:hypothetical protein n=1 Tax=Pseudodesulfovibrio sp. TaxID=2035812 RepID=UPI003D0B7F85
MADAPRFKKDYPGKQITLRQDAPEDRCGLFTGGATARIERRVKARDTMHGPWSLPGERDAWWLRLSLRCPHCGHTHEAFVPEAWIAQGLIVFLDEE